MGGHYGNLFPVLQSSAHYHLSSDSPGYWRLQADNYHWTSRMSYGPGSQLNNKDSVWPPRSLQGTVDIGLQDAGGWQILAHFPLWRRRFKRIMTSASKYQRISGSSRRGGGAPWVMMAIQGIQGANDV